MRPDCEAIVRDIAQGAVQFLVPVVEMHGIGCFEGETVKLEHHHEIAAVERNHVVVDMARIGQVARGVGLVL